MVVGHEHPQRRRSCGTGRRATIRRAAAGSRVDLEGAAELGRALAHRSKPDARPAAAVEPEPVVGDLEAEPSSSRSATSQRLGACVARRIRDRLDRDPVRGDLDRR